MIGGAIGIADGRCQLATFGGEGVTGAAILDGRIADDGAVEEPKAHRKQRDAKNNTAKRKLHDDEFLHLLFAHTAQHPKGE